MTDAEIKEAVAYYDCEDEHDAVVSYSEHGHSGPGWYVHCSSYPDEGSNFLGAEMAEALIAELGDRVARW